MFKKIDFIKYRVYFNIISLSLLFVTIFQIFTNNFEKGIDFSGGLTILMKSTKESNKDNFIKKINSELNVNIKLQNFTDGEFLITIPTSKIENKKDEVVSLVNTIADKSYIKILRSELVAPEMSKLFLKDSLISFMFAFLMIFLYILFRFNIKFAISGIVSLLYDTIITIGFVSFLRIELNLTLMTAFLTIIGYCINDKVIIFDRIRENLMSKTSGDINKIIDISINKTMTRSTITSLTTIIMSISLIFLKDYSIKNFGICLAIGIIIGTYSSLFVSTEILKILKLDFFKIKIVRDNMFYAS